MDAVAFLRIQKLGIELFAGILVLTAALTIPVNLTGTNVASLMESTEGGGGGGGGGDPLSLGGQAEAQPPAPPPAPCPEGLDCFPAIPIPRGAVYSDLDKVTMANISPGSPVLWLHWFVAVLITAYTVVVLHKYNLKSVCSRLEYLRETLPRTSPVVARTLMLTDIPGVPWNTVLDRVVRAAQGPLASVTPNKVSQTFERRLADKFWVGSGTKLVRSEVGKKKLGQKSPSAEPTSPAGEPEDHEAVYDLDSLPELEDHISAWDRAKRAIQGGTSVEELVKQELERVYGEGSVVCVNVMASQDVLRKLFAKYKRSKGITAELINRYCAAICNREERIPIEKMWVFGPVLGSWGKKHFGTRPLLVDALRFHSMRLEYLKERLEERRLDAEVLAEPTAFVTFRSLSTTSVAGTTSHHHDASSWQLQPAPEPKDVIWENVGFRLWERRFRAIVVASAFLLACIFYVVPVAAFQTVLAQDLLMDSAFFRMINSQPWIHGLLVLVLPSLGLTIVLMLMPPLLEAMGRWRGAVSQSRVERDTVVMYFNFKVVVLFIGSLVSGVVIYFSLLNSLVYRPSAIFEVLGATAPRQSFFFISFILTQGFAIRGFFNLVNPVMFFVYYLKGERARTPEGRDQASREIVPGYGYEVPTDTLALLLGLVFSVQNPLMPVAALLFFLTSGTVCRYNWIYVYHPRFQAGGTVWSNVSDQVLTGLTIFLTFMIGYLQLIQASFQATLLLVPLAGVLLFWFNTKRQLGRPQRFLSLSEAATVDERLPPLERCREVCSIYQPPFMRDDSGDLDELLGNSKLVRDALAGDLQATQTIINRYEKGKAAAV